MNEFESNQQVREDFSIKLKKGKVCNYHEYYALTEKRSITMSIKVAENMPVLKNIEKSMRVQAKPLAPIKPMLNTLEEYCRDIGENEPTIA